MLPLFAYLAFVTAGMLAVLRHRGWWWLAWPALAAAFGWTMVWLGSRPDHPESLVVGIYILVQLGLFVAFRCGVPRVAFLELFFHALPLFHVPQGGHQF